MALPKDFIDLQQAYESRKGSLISIIGVVVDLMEPTTTRTSSYMFTFRLLDPQLRDSLRASKGLMVRFFKPDLESLPQVRGLGDIVLLRGVKMWNHQGETLALSNNGTGVTVFPAASIPDPDFKIAYVRNRLECLGTELEMNKLTPPEQNYVIHLKRDMKDTLNSLASGVSNGIAGVNPFLPPHVLDDANHPVHEGISNSTALPPNVPTAPAAMRTRQGEVGHNANGAAALIKRPGEDLTGAAPKKMRPNKKFKLIKDLAPREFADLCVEVVRKFPKMNGECELYVTDYTENPSTFYYSPPEDAEDHERDGDKFNYTNGGQKKLWPGPYGHHVLRVITKPPHAGYAIQEASQGQLLWLRNVNAKHNTRLEGEMWPDNLNMEKIQISKVMDMNNELVEQLLARKEKYWSKRRQQFPEPGGNQQAGQQKMSKSERKKQRKREKWEKSAAQLQAKNAERQSNKVVPATERVKSDLNPHIRCTCEDVPISSVRDILDPTNAMHTTTTPDGTEYTLPFMNVKYRARVRVIDFHPKQLEDFAYPAPNVDDAMSDTPPPLPADGGNFKWAFSLQLEDASTKHRASATADDSNRIWVNVHHGQAQFLFNNDVDDPSDLHRESQLLARLREKLCILWGNLEERQTGEKTQISNRPFECCIAEYGVPVDEGEACGDEDAGTFGFTRLYSMFGVTIL